MKPPRHCDPTDLWLLQAAREELDELFALGNLLQTLYRQVERMRAGVILADTALHNSDQLSDALRQEFEQVKRGGSTSPDLKNRQAVFTHWTNIAAHSVIDTVFQFQEALANLNAWADTARVAEALVNRSAAVEADRLFNKHFPKWKQIRHATAHATEISLNHERNSHKGALSHMLLRKKKGVAAMISESFVNRTFTTTRRGELLTFDITAESYSKLNSIYELLLSGFIVAPERSPKNQTFAPL